MSERLGKSKHRLRNFAEYYKACYSHWINAPGYKGYEGATKHVASNELTYHSSSVPLVIQSLAIAYGIPRGCPYGRPLIVYPIKVKVTWIRKHSFLHPERKQMQNINGWKILLSYSPPSLCEIKTSERMQPSAFEIGKTRHREHCFKTLAPELLFSAW